MQEIGQHTLLLVGGNLVELDEGAAHFGGIVGAHLAQERLG
jgi:hypothetical protein